MHRGQSSSEQSVLVPVLSRDAVEAEAVEEGGLQAEGDGVLCNTARTTLGNTGRVFPILSLRIWNSTILGL